MPDNLTHTLKLDYLKRYEVPLRVSPKEEDSIEEALRQGFTASLIRAAWTIYLGDQFMHDVGTIGITQFVKHLNKYTAQIKVPPAKGMQGSRLMNHYICENAFELRFIDPKFCWGQGGFNEMDTTTTYPECFPGPCPICGAQLWRVGSGEYEQRKAQRDEDLEKSLVEAPVPVRESVEQAADALGDVDDNFW